MRATAAWSFASAKKTLGVDRDNTCTSMPTASMASRRSLGSVMGGVMPKKRAPLYLMMVRPVGSSPKANSPPRARIWSKNTSG